MSNGIDAAASNGLQVTGELSDCVILFDSFARSSSVRSWPFILAVTWRCIHSAILIKPEPEELATTSSRVAAHAKAAAESEREKTTETHTETEREV